LAKFTGEIQGNCQQEKTTTRVKGKLIFITTCSLAEQLQAGILKSKPKSSMENCRSIRWKDL